jgi:hypothetical protein
MMPFSYRSTIIALMLTLIAMVTIIVIIYPLATRPLTRSGDDAVIYKARTDARIIFHDRAAHKRMTFPIVTRLSDRTCVELRSWAADEAGTYLVCYDRRTGKKVEERAEGGF